MTGSSLQVGTVAMIGSGANTSYGQPGAATVTSGGGAQPSAEQASTSPAFPQGLTDRDRAWVNALPPNLQQQVLSLKPEQIDSLKAHGKWDTFRESVTETAVYQGEAEALRVYTEDPAVLEIEKGLKAAKLAGDVAGIVLMVVPGEGAAEVAATKVGEGLLQPQAVKTGATSVYSAVENGATKYVGITDDLAARAATQLRQKGIIVNEIPGLNGLARADARAVEQVLIEFYGLGKNGGTLLNRINSIAESNPVYAESLKRGAELLRQAGYPGF
jgi:hypothetical protein